MRLDKGHSFAGSYANYDDTKENQGERGSFLNDDDMIMSETVDAMNKSRSSKTKKVGEYLSGAGEEDSMLASVGVADLTMQESLQGKSVV